MDMQVSQSCNPSWNERVELFVYDEMHDEVRPILPISPPFPTPLPHLARFPDPTRVESDAVTRRARSRSRSGTRMTGPTTTSWAKLRSN
eukprot:2579274-Rhodomonas_salina.1